jgi:ribosomal RNA assembly protein
MQYLRVPHDRIGVILGRDGTLKRRIEEETGVRINVDSSDGNIEVDGSEARDPVMELKVSSYVSAIARGFSPEKAERLIGEDIFFDAINISDYVGGRKNRLQRMRGRVIGKEGRARKMIENLTETMISVQGDTVAIIGDPMELELARSGIDMLLRGSEHSAVFHYLESKRRDLKMKELTYYTEPEWRESE